MGRTPTTTLTDREAEIMDRLWELGIATAEQIRELLPGEPHDSTVRTLLRILEEKGFVSHERDGRSFSYKPIIHREKIQRKTLGNVIRQFFSGSPQDLVLRLIEDEQLTTADLQELMQQTTSKPNRAARGNQGRS